MYAYELIFFFTIVFNFLTPYYKEGENISEKDHAKIAIKYLNEEFITDFIPWIPL